MISIFFISMHFSAIKVEHKLLEPFNVIVDLVVSESGPFPNSREQRFSNPLSISLTLSVMC